MSGQVTLSTNEKADALMDQLEDDIEKLYGGKSAFWRSCLLTYDDKHRIQAKIELINQRIEQKENEIQDLKLQRKGLKSELEEMTVEKEDEDNINEFEMGDKEFWDKTVNKIFKRQSKDQSSDIRKRWKNWFDGRYSLFTQRYSEITVQEFRDMLLDKAEERGFNEKVNKLSQEVEA